MKNLILLLLTFAFTFPDRVHAQMAFSLDMRINNISARLYTHGDMWYVCDNVPSSPAIRSATSFPKDTSILSGTAGLIKKNITGAGAFWISAYDTSSVLHISAQLAGQVKNDFWPGALNIDSSGSLDNTVRWEHMHCSDRAILDMFISSSPCSATSFVGNYNPIWLWPGKGNILSEHFFGINIEHDMAPFADLNSNGIYEPDLGEYPDMKGDITMWWVFNDNGYTHNQTNGLPLGVEVHTMPYAYKRGGLIDNVIFYEYNIINRTTMPYHNMRISQWGNPLLGSDSINNYVGYDSVRRMEITYHATDHDAGAGGYGYDLPISAIAMIELPGDTDSSRVAAGSFMCYNDDATVMGRPTVDTEYNNYMRAKWKNGQHLVNDFSGTGIASDGYGAGPECNYAFTGDPADVSQWSECVSNNVPVKRSFVLSSNDFTLEPGESKRVVFALMTTNPGPHNGCPDTRFDSIRVLADSAYHIYRHPLAPLPAATQVVPVAHELHCYPNPAHDIVYIKDAVANGTIALYNVTGQRINASFDNKNQGLDVSGLYPGIYHVTYTNPTGQKSATFIKQ